jgi:hypothetical protein
MPSAMSRSVLEVDVCLDFLTEILIGAFAQSPHDFSCLLRTGNASDRGSQMASLRSFEDKLLPIRSGLRWQQAVGILPFGSTSDMNIHPLRR